MNNRYAFAEFGDDLLIKGVNLTTQEVETIKESLPESLRRRVIGFLNLGRLPEPESRTA